MYKIFFVVHTKGKEGRTIEVWRIYMDVKIGKQSLQFAEAPYIISSANIVGKKEGEGPLGNCFDVVGQDDKFGADTWEEAESTLQKEAFQMAVGKAGLKAADIRYLFSGDLLGQTIATSFGLMDYQVPLFGLYGACSTCALEIYS